jgi:hypothetical protein
VKDIFLQASFYFVAMTSDKFNFCIDRAIAQAVSRWLPTSAARVRGWFESGHVGNVVDKVALGQVFSE